MVALDSDNAEDLPQPSGPGTSASIVSTSTPAADGKLIGFSCLSAAISAPPRPASRRPRRCVLVRSLTIINGRSYWLC